MWTELQYCREGDFIRAYFLGDSDIKIQTITSGIQFIPWKKRAMAIIMLQ